jgi:putative FmdB family regulatory protein
MPIYEWKCKDCEIYWEDLYNRPEDAPKTKKCPKCGKRRKKAVSTFGMKFVGAGFYCNDYGKNTVQHKNAQGAVDEFVEGAKVSSNKRMKSGFQNYSVYSPDYGQLEKMGQIKKTKGSEEAAISNNAAKHRKLAEHIYTNANVDPATIEKPNVDLLTSPDKKGLE